MSDKANKRRPVLERIGALQGRGSFCDNQGFGGLPSMTDQDVAAALAMIRKKPVLLRMGGDPGIAPEILETYYGSTLQHRERIRAAYLKANPPADDDVSVIRRRLAATLAVHIVAGLTYSREQQQEYAFICRTRLETLRSEIADAHAWFGEQANAAAKAFRAVVSLSKGLKE